MMPNPLFAIAVARIPHMHPQSVDGSQRIAVAEGETDHRRIDCLTLNILGNAIRTGLRRIDFRFIYAIINLNIKLNFGWQLT
jgi:hypothetical protein